MEINNDKMKEFIHYIIYKSQEKPNFGKTLLYKIMYFADFNHYEVYERLITDETYVKRKWGSIPEHFDECCNELKTEGKIRNELVEVISHDREGYFVLKEPNTILLSDNELKVIDDVINKLSDMNIAEINNYSHGDKPFRVANLYETLDSEFVFYRNEKYSVRVYDDLEI